MKKIMIACLTGLCGIAQAAFVTIGNAGNAAHTNGLGAVAYDYKISATEVSIAELQAAGLVGAGFQDYWNNGLFGKTAGSNAPAVRITLYEAMQYCNWLTSGNIYTGAYVFASGVYQSTDRASALGMYSTVYALPTEDEWFKAAYFDGSAYTLYANGSTNTAPTTGVGNWNYNGVTPNPNNVWSVTSGGIEQNGTYNMMGNVAEWLETTNGVLRGGSYGTVAGFLSSSATQTASPTSRNAAYGFRPISIPEPATALMLCVGGIGAWMLRRNKWLSQSDKAE